MDSPRVTAQYSQYNGAPAPTQDKLTPIQSAVGSEPDGPAVLVVDEVHQPVELELNTIVPSGIVAEPGKDVFAKDDREAKKSVARYDSDQKNVERVISVVSLEGVSSTTVESVEGGTQTQTQTGAAGAREPLEVVETSSVPEPAVEPQTAVPAGRKPEGPLDHEEALADQVAHELYPDARAVPEEGLARDE